MFGPEVLPVKDGATEVLDIPCGGVAAYYSRAMSLELGQYFAVAWKAASPGVVKLQIQYEVSWILPTTEGSADGNWSIPDSATDVDADLTDENQHSNPINPPAFKYIRFKITGSGANDAGTTLQIQLSKQEHI